MTEESDVVAPLQAAEAATDGQVASATPAEMVLEFHKRFGVKFDADATLDLLTLRARLLAEEAREAGEALLEWDMPQIAKELADVVYVTYGAACSLGIDLDEAVRLVHESNMSKLHPDGLPICDEGGKILKGPNYKPPNMTTALPVFYFTSDGSLVRADGKGRLDAAQPPTSEAGPQ